MTAAGRERPNRSGCRPRNGSVGALLPWIAAELRVGLRQVEKWRRAWREGGAEALGSRGPHCRPWLDDAAFARLGAELNRGPAAHGYADDQRWRPGRVAALIRRLFGIAPAGVSLLLRRNGWSVLAPGALRHRTRR
nr:winged helix-turn-helix domain-containing protein [Actinomadura madurae]